MKKLLLFSVTSLLLLGACGNAEDPVSEEALGSTDEATAEQEEAAAEESTEETATEDYSLSVPDIEDMEIVNEVTYAYSDSSSGINWASYYSEIKNNGDLPVNLSSSSVVYTDEAGEKVLMVSDMGLDVIPQVINPGETAFVNIYDPIQNTEDFSGVYQANIEMQPIESIDTLVIHETENVNVIYNENGDFSNIRATGSVNVKEDVVGYDLVVAMYDAEGNFLGTLTGGSSDDLLTAGSSTAFETENPPFPQTLMPEVAEWEAFAYSIQ